MLLLVCVANIYVNASDILKNKKEYLVKKDWFIGKLEYLKCWHFTPASVSVITTITE